METQQVTQNSRIEDWLSARAESSHTRRNYIDHWNIFVKFCLARGKDANKIVDDFRAVKFQEERQKEIFLQEWQDLIRAYTTHLKKKYASMSFAVRLSILRSYFKYWKIPLEVDLPKHTFVTYHNRDITKAEVKKILSNASLRDRAVLVVLLESGMRVGCCVASKYWQIKDDYEQSRVPMMVKLPSASLKDHVGDRFTFIGEDGFRALQDYFETRQPLKDDDYVFQAERVDKKGAIHERSLAQSISTKFNRLVLKLGIDHSVGLRKPKQIRLHGLRKYFYNNMRADSDYRKFWMGHTLGVQSHYISRNIDDHRTRYAEGYKYLRISEPSPVSLLDLHQQLRQKDQEIEQLQGRVKSLENERTEIMELKDHVVKLENEVYKDRDQLYRDRKLFEQELGLDEETAHVKKTEKTKSQEKTETS
jgi:site-specific recombinase XerD